MIILWERLGKKIYLEGGLDFMTTVIVLVEGYTEERFVKQVLGPHLEGFEIYIIPKIITTKINKNGTNFKGGIDSYLKIKNDLNKILFDKSVFVTTLIDLYGLPNDFPNFNETTKIKDPYQKAEKLEKDFLDDIANDKFIPYLQLHEFEAILFSEMSGFEKFYSQNPRIISDLHEVHLAFPNPEFINDTPEKAPSKRILKIIPEYRKPSLGASISSVISVTSIIEKCPHFSEWINKLTRLCSN